MGLVTRVRAYGGTVWPADVVEQGGFTRTGWSLQGEKHSFFHLKIQF